MAAVDVTLEQRVAASVERVWQIITVPRLAAELDARTSLVSASGEPGVVGSIYYLDLKTHRSTVRQKIEVSESSTAERLVTISTTGTGGAPVRQVGLLAEQHGSTLLTWTVELRAPRVLAPLVRAIVRRQLASWLGSVSIAASSV